jgi:hypothetical protein
VTQLACQAGAVSLGRNVHLDRRTADMAGPVERGLPPCGSVDVRDVGADRPIGPPGVGKSGTRTLTDKLPSTVGLRSIQPHRGAARQMAGRP